jgi:hypothetical protein
MGKAIADLSLDQTLIKIATATRMVVCSGEPANFAGIAAVALADNVLTAGDGNGDYVIANGTVSGRKLTVQAQSAFTIDSSGTATHISLDDGSNLLAVTTCTSQALTAAGTCSVPAYIALEIRDPT